MAKKRLLITGVCGLLGQNLVRCLHPDYEITGVDILPQAVELKGLKDYIHLDITLKEKLKTVFEGYSPNVIINTAALTNVDLCEKEKEKAKERMCF